MCKIPYMMIGAAIMLTVQAIALSNERVAAYVSQQIYDCGIRVAAGVTDGEIKGFTIVGHKYGYCQEVADDTVKFRNNALMR